jgi:hypothetical protein
MAQHEKIRFHFLSQRAWVMLEIHLILCTIQICDSSLSLCMCVKDKLELNFKKDIIFSENHVTDE